MNGVKLYTTDAGKLVGAGLYYCGHCKVVYQTEQAAEDCCKCLDCGITLDFLTRVRCHSCGRKFRDAKRLEHARKARQLLPRDAEKEGVEFVLPPDRSASDGIMPLFALDDLEAGGEHYAWVCYPVPFPLPETFVCDTMERIIESLREDLHEEIGDQLVGEKELEQALRFFAERNQDPTAAWYASNDQLVLIPRFRGTWEDEADEEDFRVWFLLDTGGEPRDAVAIGHRDKAEFLERARLRYVEEFGAMSTKEPDYDFSDEDFVEHGYRQEFRGPAVVCEGEWLWARCDSSLDLNAFPVTFLPSRADPRAGTDESPDCPERAEIDESPARVERAGRPESSEPLERAEADENPERAERAVPLESPEVDERADHLESPELRERAENDESPERFERAKAPESPERFERAGTIESPESAERAVKRRAP